MLVASTEMGKEGKKKKTPAGLATCMTKKNYSV